MQIQVVKSKIHRVTVTGADLNYIGSITIDEALMEASNIIEGEVHRGDIVIIISYGIMDFEEAKKFKPTLVFPNEKDNSLT